MDKGYWARWVLWDIVDVPPGFVVLFRLLVFLVFVRDSTYRIGWERQDP